MKKLWKNLFFILLSVNIIIVAWLYYYLTSIDETKPIENINSSTDAVPFVIQTNKKDVNSIINQYLKDEGNGVIDYTVTLDKYVNLYGAFPIFNQTIDMKVAFEPQALENGDLILKEKEISIGKLQLPPATVLKFVKDRYRFPDWVTIQPDKERVYVDLQKMKLKSDLQVRVNEFDLIEDRIMFTLLVPLEKGVSQ